VVFRVITLLSSVAGYWYSGGEEDITYIFTSAPKMETAGSSETTVPSAQATQRKLEGHHMNLHRRENVSSTPYGRCCCVE